MIIFAGTFGMPIPVKHLHRVGVPAVQVKYSSQIFGQNSVMISSSTK